MTVVSDAGPLRYLILIGRIELLDSLFPQIVVPTPVLDELRRSATPEQVQNWVISLPAWISEVPAAAEPFAPGLGAGESAALRLAVEREGFLLSDDRAAVSVARGRGIVSFGTLGVILRAHQRGFADFEESIAALRGTNLYLSNDAVQTARRLL